jgi:hypothetical protein
MREEAGVLGRQTLREVRRHEEAARLRLWAVGVLMKYRRCLWCREYFWAERTQKCCCPEHQTQRDNELHKKRLKKARERRAKLKEKILAKIMASGSV